MPTIPESIQVWVVCVTNHSAPAWRPVLNKSEWEKVKRFRMPADQLRCAVTRGILKTLLGRYLDLPANNINFTPNEFGKLALEDNPIHFNVSHSGAYALLAFAKHSPVGIDVEHMSDHRVVSELATRVLCAAEYQRFMSLPDTLRKRTFFEIWTLKESLLKGIGSGLSVPPEHLEISFYPAKPELLFAATEHIPDVRDWTIQSLSIGDADYAAAIAVKHKTPSIEIKHFE